MTNEAQLKTMTIGQLKAMLANFGEGHDNQPVQIWLPGSRVAISGNMFREPGKDGWLIEGNVQPGSALDKALDLVLE